MYSTDDRMLCDHYREKQDGKCAFFNIICDSFTAEAVKGCVGFNPREIDPPLTKDGVPCNT
jgi:hypothetical protein